MGARAQTIRQADISRAIKAAQANGLTVAELVTTRDGVRVVTLPAGAGGTGASPNPWDRFLTDAAQE